jgi:hypothetical protein
MGGFGRNTDALSQARSRPLGDNSNVGGSGHFNMTTAIVLTVACLAIAVVCAATAERRQGLRIRWAGASLLALYGVCIGVVMLLLVYFFAIGEAGAIALAVPLGAVALGFTTKAA